MAAMPGEATMAVVRQGFQPAAVPGWVFRDLGFLKKDLDAFIKTKTIGMSIFYVILMFLALLAVFNTQVLAVFRRRREIGTMIALGMTRATGDRAVHPGRGPAVAPGRAHRGGLRRSASWPWFKAHGWKLPAGQADNFGLTIGNVLYPVYSVGLVVGTAALVFFATAVVSFLPARKIARLKPTDALKGKLK